MKPKLIVISGFSGAGKGKLTQLLATRHDCLKIIRSCTTRPRRDASDHYTYLSEAEFLAMRENDAFLECNYYLDHWYGTPRDETCHILREGRQAIAEIDYHGFFQLLESRLLPREAVCGIFVAAEASVLYDRLCGRGSESPDTLKRRLCTALEESSRLCAYDCIVINDDLERALAQCEAIILEGRRLSSAFDTARFHEEMNAIIAKLSVI